MFPRSSWVLAPFQSQLWFCGVSGLAGVWAPRACLRACLCGEQRGHVVVASGACGGASVLCAAGRLEQSSDQQLMGGRITLHSMGVSL